MLAGTDSLSSIIVYVGETGAADSLGHYTSHCKRSKGYWEIHDD